MTRFNSKRKDSKDKERERKANRPLFKRKKFCRFTAEGVKKIDYKDVELLKDFINENGRVNSSSNYRYESILPTSVR